MNPAQHREQAEILLTEARETAHTSGDPKSPSYEARMRRAELQAMRAIGHALLGGTMPEVSPPAPIVLEDVEFDGGRP